MINSGDCVETTRVMAVFAAVASQNMNRGLASRRGTVVAAGTTGRHTCMIKYRTGKSARIMTVVTGIAALDMTAGLPWSLGSVVAGGTTSQDRRMIHTGNCREARRIVAIGTILSAFNVLQGLTHRRHHATTRVANSTIPGGSPENTSDMAIITG